MNFGPQTGQNRTGDFTRHPLILRSASLPGAAQCTRPTEPNQTLPNWRRQMALMRAEPNKVAPHSERK